MSLAIVLSGSCLCGGIKYRIASKASWFEITDQLPQFAVVPTHQS
jgi:hypothetical protein